MTENLEILESAICDVGYWSWWTERLPAAFQVEFRGVQLWVPSLNESSLPSGQISLRFSKPSSVVFLRREHPTEFPLADDWYEQFRADKIGTFSVRREAFTLTSFERAKTIQHEANSKVIYHGTATDTADAVPHGVCCAFWAGPIGLYLSAERMTLCSHHGDIPLGDVIPMSQKKWWNYWREYWKRKDSDSPLPPDYACEATIPLADESA